MNAASVSEKNTVAPEGGIRPWRWSREEFGRLAEMKLLPPDRDFELLNGEIVEMSPPNPPHSGRVNFVYEIVKAAFGEGFCLRTEQPLVLSPDSQPQPDIVVCAGRLQDYFERFPTASEAHLVLEISDTTLEGDRSVKGALYAAAGIRDYWILNLRERRLEVYRNPTNGEYRLRQVFRSGEAVTPLSAPAATITAAQLLGEP